MSKVFITKNGQFLSRGEGVLTQIENPDLEVNDIGVEVSEKIAEDVKEGDLLFKNFKTFDLNKRRNFIGYFNTIKGDCFAVHEGELYSLSKTVLKVYRNNRWEVDESYLCLFNSDQYTDLNQGGSRTLLTTSSGDFYIISCTGERQPVFFKKQQNRWVNLGDCLDASSEDFHLPDSAQLYAPRALDAKEVGDKIHVIYDYSPDVLEYTLAPFIFDPVEENLSPATIDASGSQRLWNSYQGGMTIFELSGTAYLIDPEGGLFKYTTSSNHWSYIPGIDFGTAADNYDVIETSSGVFVGSRSWYGFHNFWKFDPVTETAINLDATNNWGFPISADQRYGSVGFFEDNGNIYSWGVGYRIDASSVPFYTGKYNIETSTFSNVSSIENIPMYENAPTNVLTRGGQVFKHDDKVHAFCLQYRDPVDVHLLWDRDTERFKLNNYSEYPPGLNGTYEGYTNAFDIFEFSGTYYTVAQQTGTTNDYYITFSKYITSGDPSGYFELMNPPDLAAGNLSYSAKFYEYQGELYCFIVGSQASNMRLYQLDQTDDTFKKLATPATLSGIDRSREVDIIEYSGNTYCAVVDDVAASIYVDLYSVEGSSFTPLPALSSLPAVNGNYATDCQFLEYSGSLFLCLTPFTSQTTGDKFNVYKFDNSTSGFEQIQIIHNLEPSSAYNTNFSSTAQVHSRFSYSGKLLEDDGNLYLVGATEKAGIVAFKYDGTEFWHDRDFIPNFGKNMTYMGLYNHDGYIYIPGTSYGRYTTITYRTPDKKWRSWNLFPDGHLYNAENYGFFNINGNIFFHAYNNTLRGPVIYNKSEFFNEYVWQKNIDFNFALQEPLATGIALQDGSKGDIIKIRRIRR